MARIFLSHSNRDNEAAANILSWLKEQGFDQTYLDIDKHGGTKPGADWEKTLYREIDRSQAMILVLTPNWFDSKWCFAEFTQGRALGKAIFPIIVAPTGEQIVAPDIQYLDLTTDREGGLEKLSAALRDVALDAQGGFDWDRTRPPYPGLMYFQAEDAAIFFGRDDDIRRVIERLNARRIQGGARLLVLLAASGAGKSSLLRAGVLPRLTRDKHNWMLLPPFRPQLRPVDELAKVLALALGQGSEWSAVRDQLMGDKFTDVLEGIADQIRMGQAANEAQILVSIDQAEELFGMAEAKQAKRFSEILNHMCAGDLPYLAVAAMRADYLGQLQQAKHLNARFEDVSLKPLPIERVRQIIEGPARVASLKIDEALIGRAIKDAETEDALPLLAFTLRELYERFGSDGDLTLDEYLRLGDEKLGLSPLENSVRKAADEVLANERPSDDELKALREAFVPAMVRVNEEGNYVRRPANWHDLPSKAHRLLEKFASARLLVIRQEGDQKTIEVTHEALLRKWPTLKGWLDKERDFLIGKTQLEQSLADWQQAKGNVKDEALLRGLQLNRARQWLIDHSQALSTDERAFIQASIAHSDATARRERRRSQMITYGSLGFAAVVAVVSQNLWLPPSDVAAHRVLGWFKKADFKDCSFCPEMVVVPRGQFLMGSPWNELGRRQDEDNTAGEGGDQVRVVIPADFAVSKYEVTFDQWERCVYDDRCNGVASRRGWRRDGRPVINVSWNDAQEYVKWLSELTGATYRLLSEAEWEYAARARSQKPWSYGDNATALGEHEWYSAKGNTASSGPKPVGKKKPNKFGLYDMHGNVREWVQDCWREDYSNLPTNGSAVTSDNCELRVIRGGNWRKDEAELRSAARHKNSPRTASQYYGFRVARELAQARADCRSGECESGRQPEPLRATQIRTDSPPAARYETRSSSPPKASKKSPVVGQKCTRNNIRPKYCVSSFLEPQEDNRGLNAEYGPDRLIDDLLDTAWAEGKTGNGEGEWIRVDFGGPRSISALEIYNGYQKNEGLFRRNNRVRDIEILFSNDQRRLATLDDTMGPQTINLDGDITAEWVQIKIESIYDEGTIHQDTLITDLKVISSSSI